MAPKATQVEVQREALSIASSWMQSMKSAVKDAVAFEEEEESGADLLVSRPARLGLGSKFVPHSKALKTESEDNNRLVGKLKKMVKKKDERFERSVEKRKVEDDDEEESRTKSIQPKKSKIAPEPAVPPSVAVNDKQKKKKNKKNKKSKETVQANAGETEKGEKQAERKDKEKKEVQDKEKKEVQDKEKKEVQDKGPAKNVRENNAAKKQTWGKDEKQNDQKLHSEENSDQLGGVIASRNKQTEDRDEQGDDTGRREDGHKPRRRRIKGKKTRSRQKNIRKDHRPENLRPGGKDYLARAETGEEATA